MTEGSKPWNYRVGDLLLADESVAGREVLLSIASVFTAGGW